MRTWFWGGPTSTSWIGTVVAVLVILSFAENSRAQSEKTAVALPPPLAGSSGILDGRQFKAGIVRADADEDTKKRPLGDQLLFQDGKFSSAVCKRYNFEATPYWVRTEGNMVHFLAELTSPTDGTMVWKGIIRGRTLEGTMRWTKKRWYWTIDTEHRIRGELEAGDPALVPAN